MTDVRATDFEDEEGNPLYLMTPCEARSFHRPGNVLVAGKPGSAGSSGLLVRSDVEQRPPVGAVSARIVHPVACGGRARSSTQCQTRTKPGVGCRRRWRARARRCRRMAAQFPVGSVSDPSGGVLRMPKFNMSPDEATQLVNYFAAVDRVDYPIIRSVGAEPNRPARMPSTPGRLGDLR